MARECSRATGVPLHTCLQWAEEGRIGRHQPVPDAATPDQRQFEAMILLRLAELLRDRQLDGALFGALSVDPNPGGIPHVELHPEMAAFVIDGLLPWYDPEYGGVRGIPGMRPAPSKSGHLLLQSMSGTAAVEFSLPEGVRLADSGLRRGHTLWRDASAREHAAEATEIDLWSNPRDLDPVARDFLFSRLLRRPRLTGLIATTHGLANTFSHGDRDLVIEWCCGATESETMAVLEQSGLTSSPPELAALPIEVSQTLSLGDVPIHLRHVSCYVPPTYGADLLDAYRSNFPLSSIGPLHTEGMEARDTLNLRTQILTYLRKSYTDPNLTIDEVAQACLVSKRTLYRVCEDIGGPALLVRRMRVEHARRLMRADPARSLSAIAAASGFATDRHFYRQFRQETGLTPGQFRTERDGGGFPVR
ncbi:hypothetical protein GCM10027167_11150 [Nocardia heshunensis]